MAKAKDNNKQPYMLLSVYKELYRERYKREPQINIYREKWGMQDVIDSIGFERAKEVLEYYFKTSKPGHPIQQFFFNFDKLNNYMVELEKDRANREKLRQETQQMVAERELNEH